MTEDEFPSDDIVRQAVARAGPGGILFEDLIKVVDMRRLGAEKVRGFHQDLLDRKVATIHDETGGIIVASEPAIHLGITAAGAGAQDDLDPKTNLGQALKSHDESDDNTMPFPSITKPHSSVLCHHVTTLLHL